MLESNIPILRVFDVAKTKEFYIDWLRFRIDWERQFEPATPVYFDLSKDEVQFHLSEHYGDSTPGTKVFIIRNKPGNYCQELKRIDYKYYRPGIEKTFYGTLCMEVTDPFDNKLSFNEYLPAEDDS